MIGKQTGSVFICAGEPSGDLYAALYVDTLRTSGSYSGFFGVGGPCMSDAGVRIIYGPGELGSFGFHSALHSLAKHLHALRSIKKAIARVKPALFIAVAYPGLNLLLIPYARRLGCRVHYLLPPQAWAWGRFRVNLVARWVDRVVSVFRFECEFYRRHGIRVQYWENPLRNLLEHYARTDATPCIGFMPGSRRREIRRNLKVIAAFLERLKTGGITPRFSIILRDPDAVHRDPHTERVVQDLERRYAERLTVHVNNRYAAMKNCDFLVTCSGTASLEAAFMGIPQVFFNRCSWFDYTLMRPFVSIKEYNLANLYFGGSLVPSCITFSESKIGAFLTTIDIGQYIN